MDAVLGIVLAAGRSERMGRPKALLEAGERTFLRAAVEALHGGGCEDVVVVVATSDVETEARLAGARVVWNDARDAEQIDSLRLGLDAASDDATAAVLMPVDHPLVKPTTVRALLDAHGSARGEGSAIVRPVNDGRPGHPTLFPRSVWPVLRDASLSQGARSVVEARDIPTVDVPVDDPGVVADIDTPESYDRHIVGP